MLRRAGPACLLAFLLHGSLILAGVYRLSYDAFNHMFFADHYLHGWWSLWEPRWYAGFEVTAYPPLVHQIIAILARLAGLFIAGLNTANANPSSIDPVGLDAASVDIAYALLLWVVLSAYPLGVYAFSRIFSGRRAAGYAALGGALLPALFLSAHNFGQLPSITSSLFALFGAAALAQFLRRGGLLNGALAVSLFATAAAGHHATLLFQPWLAGSVLLKLAAERKNQRPRTGLRFACFALLAGLAALAVVWPFWEWGTRQTMQTPIDHLSRHSFFSDPHAAFLFFLLMYGLLVPWLPVAAVTGMRKRYRWLAAAFFCLFLLGLGGTTPLPQLIFGPGWAWLTYDRFAFWAALLLLPFAGTGLALLRRSSRPGLKRLAPGYLLLLGASALFTGASPAWLPTQPQPIPMQAIVNFLEQADRNQYRYLTFGFGDQMAYLSRLTRATTIDGSYHTARNLPELRTSGVGQIDSAFWIPNGMAALEPVLEKAGERGVRWGFVALSWYQPLLVNLGWEKKGRLANGIEVWENPDASLPPADKPAQASPFAAFSWGTFPLLALSLSTALALRRYSAPVSISILKTARAAAIGLLPFGLTLWYYRDLFVISHPRIYFLYSNAVSS
jgi:hypothetical protein